MAPLTVVKQLLKLSLYLGEETSGFRFLILNVYSL